MANSGNDNGRRSFSLAQAAAHAGVTPATLRRWAREGLIPQYRGEWTGAAVGHGRIVARMRERGHSLPDIRRATDEGRLAFGYVEELFPLRDGSYSRRQAARATGLEPALIERIMTTLGLSEAELDSLTEDDMQLLRYVSAVLSAGLPLVAMLQLVRVWPTRCSPCPASCCRSPRRSWTRSISGISSTSSSRTWSATWRPISTARSSMSDGCAWRSRLPTR